MEFKYFGLALTRFVTIVSIRSVLGGCPDSQVRHAVQSYIPSCPGEGTTGTKEVEVWLQRILLWARRNANHNYVQQEMRLFTRQRCRLVLALPPQRTCEEVVKSLTAMF